MADVVQAATAAASLAYVFEAAYAGTAFGLDGILIIGMATCMAWLCARFWTVVAQRRLVTHKQVASHFWMILIVHPFVAWPRLHGMAAYGPARGGTAIGFASACVGYALVAWLAIAAGTSVKLKQWIAEGASGAREQMTRNAQAPPSLLHQDLFPRQASGDSSWGPAALLVGVSLVLYLACLAQPAYVVSARAGAHAVSGASALGVGAFGLLGGIFEWLANPLLLLSWLFAAARRFGLSAACAFVALLFALGFLLRTQLPLDEASNLGAIVSRESGYGLWIGSIATMLLGSLVLGLDNAKRDVRRW